MTDRNYLLRRAAQEAELAEAATDERAAAIHAAMASEYLRRLGAKPAKRGTARQS